ncbi:Uncharacterised protein [Brevibacterium casei]|uniref:Uncharacterized protein n=1 Tax=Brevibacterium casei TaxID=33889 RepID=A0A449D9N4_9MICO|nr:Uncharacterised protein [Brevibacterium casei]
MGNVIHSASVRHDDCSVCAGGGIDVVGDHDHSSPSARKVVKMVEDQVRVAEVKSRGGLIREDDSGLGGEDACDGNALLLAAG